MSDRVDGAKVEPIESASADSGTATPTETKKSLGQKVWELLKEPGSALQIVIAAALAIAIGLAVSSTVETIPPAAPAILGIPGVLWLRALKAVVLPLIVTSIILAVQRLKEMTGSGSKLAWATILFYVLTTIAAVIQSCLMVSLVWAGMFTPVSSDSLTIDEDDQEMVEERESVEIHEVVVQMFESFIPNNVVNALSEDSLLAVLVSAIVVGALIRGPDSSILRFVTEVERIVMRVITFLIKCAPIGVFFLILPNLFKLDIREVGENLGIFIGASIVDMFIHLFVVLPVIYFAFTRKNPFAYWIANARAWCVAWATASSAATLPVTLRCARERGLPVTVTKFALPLGALINMDGTAIYFPVVVTFMAASQGITLSVVDYIIIVLLATLAAIGTTPIPSSSLVLTVMIAGSVNVPVTGMYAVVVAIDWFLDRFRTAVNVSGDLYGAAVVTRITKIKDSEYSSDEDSNKDVRENTNRV